jgi:hypothetical protein
MPGKLSMNEVKWAALAAAGLMAIVPDANAEASASASITNFRYSLIDLDPGDGIAPSVSFFGGVGLSVTAQDLNVDGTRSSSDSASGALGSAISLSAVEGLSSAYGQTFAADPSSGQPGLAAWASAKTAGDGNSASSNVNLWSGVRLTLSPRTAIALTANTSNLSITTSVLGETAHARAGVSMFSEEGPNPQQSFGQSWISISAEGVVTSNLSNEVRAYYPNISDFPLNVAAFAGADVTVRGPVSAVPEVRSSGLVMLGLLALAPLLRRRGLR